jgi:hypothetical protein
MTIDRRSLLQTALASAAAGSVSLAAAEIAAAQSSSKTYVLVHGAWHGGWCWKDVADGLRSMGHRVSTPTQTGVGERKHLLSKDITLDTFTSDVVNHIFLMLFPPTDAEEQARVRARISMIHNPDNPAAALVGRTFESAAGALGVEPTIAHIHGLADIEQALSSAGTFSRGGRGIPC